jgi:hypothetical protein
MKEQSKRGGKREGSGRKALPFKFKTVTFRVPEDQVQAAKELIRKLLAEYRANQ